MRKQYSFWPGEEGLLAWDVDRLVESSGHLAIEEVAVDSIDQVDTNYWFSDELWPPTVRRIIEHIRLIESVDLSYPIILGPDGRVMDGMHRVARAILDGLTTISAVRLEVLPPPDYRNARPEDLPY